MKLTKDNALFGHVSEETALTVDDYPYGFRLRTSIRYWIETTKHGDRFVSQTLNPKTGKWNKPKKSTYIEIAVMYRDDETGHIEWTGLRHHSEDEFLADFRAITDGHLSDAQTKKLAEVIGLKKAFEHITFSIHQGPSTPEEDAEQAQQELNARKLMAIEVNRAAKDLGL